jgi:PAS domain-containing protein
METADRVARLAWRARPDLSCEYVSPAWLDFAGGEGWPGRMHPDDLARWLDTCLRAFDERRPFSIEYRLRRRDGAYCRVLDRAQPRYDAQGAFVGYAGECVELGL